MEAKIRASDGTDNRAPNTQLRIEEGKEIIAKASRLKCRMARDQEFE